MKNTVKHSQVNLGLWSILFRFTSINKPTVRQRKLNIRRI